MFCFCRMLRHVSAIKYINKRTGVNCLQSISSNHVHTQYSSKEYRENVFQEKGPFSELVQDIRSSEIIWKKQRHNKVFQEFLKECFRKSDGSPSYAINLLRIATDKSSTCSTDLVSSLISEFGRYLTENDIQFAPTDEEKMDAINSVLLSGNYQILQLVCNVFKIDGKEGPVKKLIDELVKHQQLIEAAYCVGVLNLQHEYEIEDIIIPLLLNGKVQPVNVCLLNQPDLQKEMAKKLDSKLATRKPSDVNEYVKDSRRTKNALDSFIKHFKIPPKECKNLYYIRGRDALNHLTKRLSQQSITPSRWEEMVMTILTINPDLKQHLEYKLEQIYDKETALKMMEKLEMSEFDAASIAKSDEGINLDELEEIDNEETEITVDENHLTLPLADDAIKFIDTEDKFNNFLSDITKNYKILGIDSEWKPHFGLSKDRLSLIQLAVHDKVYILDVLSLSECLSAEQWDELNHDVFGNSNIIKLGCDMITDIQMIVNINKGTSGKRIRFSHILDMVIFFDRLQKTYPDLIKAEEQKDRNMGLSKLCETVLGKPLNKEERLCDWEKRPLSESQLGYAALDAYCLLQIYDKLKEISSENDMNFELQAKNSMVLTAAQNKPKKGLNQMVKENQRNIRQRRSVSIQEFKVAVDPELKVQGDHLEKLGADVLILSKSASQEEVAKIVNIDGRMLLCSEKMFHRVHSKLPPWSYFKSANLVDSYVTISNILQRFNVFIPKSSFSHCKICNNKETFKLSPEHANLLQDHIVNKTELVALQDDDNLNQILCNMKKSGITLKFCDQSNSSTSETEKKILCTNCGTIQ